MADINFKLKKEVVSAENHLASVLLANKKLGRTQSHISVRSSITHGLVAFLKSSFIPRAIARGCTY